MSAAKSLMIVVVLIICAHSVCATEITYQSPRELGKQSTLVVLGTVSGVRSYWNEKKTKIFTEIDVSVEQGYKGQTPGSVKLLQLGGTVGNVRVHVSGALSWSPGEEALLFLQPSVQGSYQVSGFSQGKFPVERDPQTGKAFVKYVQPEPAARGRIISSEDAGSISEHAGQMPLDEFVADALKSE
jgi:hypothetical protein